MPPSPRPLAVAVLVHLGTADDRQRAAARAFVTGHAHCEGYALLHTYDLDAGSPLTARTLTELAELAAGSGVCAVLVHGLPESDVHALTQRHDLRVLPVTAPRGATDPQQPVPDDDRVRPAPGAPSKYAMRAARPRSRGTRVRRSRSTNSRTSDVTYGWNRSQVGARCSIASNVYRLPVTVQGHQRNGPVGQVPRLRRQRQPLPRHPRRPLQRDRRSTGHHRHVHRLHRHLRHPEQLWYSCRGVVLADVQVTGDEPAVLSAGGVLVLRLPPPAGP